MARSKSDIPATQVCDQCGDDLPLDASHFDRKRGTSTGFRSTCKTCRHEERASGITVPDESGKSKAIAVGNKFDEEALTTLQSFVGGPGTRVPHVAEVWEAFNAAFGGPFGIARHTMMTFLASPPGSDRRVKILGMLARIAASTTASGATTKRVEDMTDEELSDFVSASSVRMLATQSPTVLADILRSAGLRVEGDMSTAFAPPAAPARVEAKVIDVVPEPSAASHPPPPAPPPVILPVDPEIESLQVAAEPEVDESVAPAKFQIPKVERAGVEEICPVMGTPIVRKLREVDDVSEL